MHIQYTYINFQCPSYGHTLTRQYIIKTFSKACIFSLLIIGKQNRLSKSWTVKWQWDVHDNDITLSLCIKIKQKIFSAEIIYVMSDNHKVNKKYIITLWIYTCQFHWLTYNVYTSFLLHKHVISFKSQVNITRAIQINSFRLMPWQLSYLNNKRVHC